LDRISRQQLKGVEIRLVAAVMVMLLAFIAL
jgi:hypothetical protein